MKEAIYVSQDILTAISTVGFPIAACCGLFWYLTRQSENHKAETAALTSAISKLELAINELIIRIGGER